MRVSDGEPGRVPESSEVRNARVLEWLNRDGLYEELLDGAREQFAKSGRGFWHASPRNAAGPVIAVAWVRADDLVEVIRAAPGGTVRGRVTRFVRGTTRTASSCSSSRTSMVPPRPTG
jgi:hypothetical protein